MVISVVLLLPSSSSSNHCQKRVIAIKPLQSLDHVHSLIKSLNYSHKLIDQTIPSKTQPKTSWSELLRTYMRRQKFLRFKHAPYVLPRAARTSHMLVLCHHALHAVPRAWFSPCEAMLALGWWHPTTSVYCVICLCQQLPSDCWLALLTVEFFVDFLTKVKIFQQGLSCSIFCVDSVFGLCFFIGGP